MRGGTWLEVRRGDKSGTRMVCPSPSWAGVLAAALRGEAREWPEADLGFPSVLKLLCDFVPVSHLSGPPFLQLQNHGRTGGLEYLITKTLGDPNVLRSSGGRRQKADSGPSRTSPQT